MNYIDRDDFINKSKRFIDMVDKPSIILIAANQGIGKHSSVLKLFEQTWTKHYHKLAMLSYSSTEGTSIIKNKYFFSIISLLVSNYEPFNDYKNNLSFYKFIKNNRQIQRKISNSISLQTISDSTNTKGTIASLIILFLKYIRNRMKLANPELYLNLLAEESVISANIGKDYLNYILCNDNVILDLRSVQYMDNETVFNICNSLKSANNSSKSIIIMEYDTDCINNPSDFTLFRSLLQSAIGFQNVFSYDLKPLNLDDFVSVLSQQIDQNINNYLSWIKKEYLELGTKSINKAINNFYIADQQGELFNDLFPTIDYRAYFNKIGAACLCILSILDIHGGRISKLLLKKLFSLTDIVLNEGYLQERLELMVKQHLIIADEKDVCFFNRDVKSVWEEYLIKTNEKSPGILIAAAKCYDYYEIKIRNNYELQESSRINEPIVILLRIIELYIPNRIINLSSYIQLIAQCFISPEKAWESISLLLNELSRYKNDYLETYYKIIDLCCDLELYQEALQIWYDIKEVALDTKSHEFNRVNYIHCKVHYLADEYDKVLSFIKNKMKHNLKSTSELYYSIYLIITYRSINQYEKITPIVEEIIDNNEKYKSLPQYGLFLRISETYKSRTDAIPDVLKSVKVFKKYGLETQAAKSNISLSFLYTITGDLNNGLRSLKEAKNVLKNSYKHILSNNEAAIRLFQGKFDDYTENLLKEAIMHSNGVFSNLVIYSNLMIFYYETHDLSNLLLRINDTKNAIVNLVDKHLLAVISYNLYYFLKDIDNQESKKYYNISYENIEHDAALKARICNLEPKNDCECFVLSKPWHVTMLSFWETDFMID